MNSYFIAGSSGFIGLSLVNYLLSHGHQVFAHTRSKSFPINHPNLSVISSDYNCIETLSSALDNCSVCINLASPAHCRLTNRSYVYENFSASHQALFNLLKACSRSGIIKFVHVSSAGVMGQYASITSPFSSSSPLNPYNLYTLSKASAEILVQSFLENTSINLITLRPPLVYAKNCPGSLKTLINIISQSPIIPFGALSNYRSFLYLDSLLSAIHAVSESPSIFNKTFVVSDKNPVLVSDLINVISECIHRSHFRNIHVPRSILAIAAKTLFLEQQWKSLSYDFVLDTSFLSTTSDWSPHDNTLLTLSNVLKE